MIQILNSDRLIGTGTDQTDCYKCVQSLCSEIHMFHHYRLQLGKDLEYYIVIVMYYESFHCTCNCYAGYIPSGVNTPK